MSHKILFVIGAAVLVIAAVLFFGSTSAPEVAQAQGGEECEGPCPQWIVDAWAASAHANAEAEAFRHWDSEDPQEVPVECAKCHSEVGYLDFLGADGSTAGEVDQPAPVNTVVSCTACHNPVAAVKDTVVFPSGVEITGAGPSARCMECHQGRAAGASVTQAVESLGLGLDESSDQLGFINIHYFAAAASLYGSEVGGGFQYEGKAYQTKFEHAAGLDSCTDCHNPHTLEIEVETCATCHTGVTSAEDLKAVRMPGSLKDYDGDGDTTESTYAELEGLQELLYSAIQAYASEVVGTPIVYDVHAYPYFFIDTDADGQLTEGEAAFPNRYVAFTPRLLQAAYNFQMYEKDPGAFAHNARYHVQLMYDSIASLNEALATPVDITNAQRNSAGHFDGTAEAFRHWDAEDPAEVPGTCAKCHTSEGLPFFLHNGVNIATEPSTALECTTCHNPAAEFALYPSDTVVFPSGAELSFGEGIAANLCLNCHQGRSSTVAVDRAIASAGVGDDEVSENLRFINIHYFAAGATLFGSEAQGIYQYAEKEYAGRFVHVPNMADTCVACHDPHLMSVNETLCSNCHGPVEPSAIRMMAGDWDGDAAAEGVAGEIATLEEELYAAIQAYAADTVGAPIVYDAHAYPYFFADANANGAVDEGEGGYASWTPRLLRAAYNYQYVAKDPGAYAHNGRYVAQVLYDTLADLGADMTGKTRP